MIDEKNTQQQKKRTKNNAQTRKKEKHKTKSSSQFNLYQSEEGEAPLQCANSLLLRSRKIQSKPVSQTWHKSAGHFRLLISLFKLKFHVVHASFFLIYVIGYVMVLRG